MNLDATKCAPVSLSSTDSQCPSGSALELETNIMVAQYYRDIPVTSSRDKSTPF